MDITTARAISMLALGLGAFFSGMLPACFSEAARQRHPLLLSCLLCFGGGVLLSTSLVHMLPETREKLPQYSELTLCIGFFTVYLVDELSHLFYSSNSHERHSHVGEQTRLLPRDHDGEMRDREASELCHVSHTEPCNRSSSSVVGLLSALFVHSVLEGLAIGLQESATQLATEFKRPPLIFQNTYQTEPTVRFHVPSVKKCMNEVLDKQFTGHVYNASVSPGLTIIIAGEIMRSVKKLGFNRYRIISVVTIAQKRSQSYHNAVSFLWDHERDGIVNTQRELHTAFIQATVFGVYLD